MPLFFGGFSATEMERVAGFALEYSKKSGSRYCAAEFLTALNPVENPI